MPSKRGEDHRTNWQEKGTTLCALWLWPKRTWHRGLTSMPKHLESRTDRNAHAAQTDGRWSVPEILEPNVPEPLFHTMGNSHLKSDGSPLSGSHTAQLEVAGSVDNACSPSPQPRQADSRHRRSASLISCRSPLRASGSPHWCCPGRSFCSLCETPWHAREWPWTHSL